MKRADFSSALFRSFVKLNWFLRELKLHSFAFLGFS
jgi:hypothetical protein